MDPSPQTGAVNAEQIAAMRQTFDTIVTAPWFHDTEDTRRHCSDLVARVYCFGYSGDPESHMQCVETAKSRFGKSTAGA